MENYAKETILLCCTLACLILALVLHAIGLGLAALLFAVIAVISALNAWSEFKETRAWLRAQRPPFTTVEGGKSGGE